MQNFWTNFALLIFRVSIGSFMLFGHGLGKFQKVLSGAEIKFFNFAGLGTTVSLYLSTFAEFFASILLIFGLFTRFSTLTLIINMSVAAFIAHADDSFATKEKALLYLASTLLIFLVGSGKFSLQTILNKRLKNSNGLIKFILG